MRGPRRLPEAADQSAHAPAAVALSSVVVVAGSLRVRDIVRAQGLKVVPLCPFVAGYIAKHPEYADLLR